MSLDATSVECLRDGICCTHIYSVRSSSVRGLYNLRARREAERNAEEKKEKKENEKRKTRNRETLATKRKRQATAALSLGSRENFVGRYKMTLIRLISLDLDRHHRPRNMQRLTSRVFAQTPSSCDRLKRGIRVAPSRPN